MAAGQVTAGGPSIIANDAPDPVQIAHCIATVAYRSSGLRPVR